MKTIDKVNQPRDESGNKVTTWPNDEQTQERADADNRNRYVQENSANGLDSQRVRGSQNGRNERGIASTDMDGKNGILRMGDQSTSTMEVTPEGAKTAAESGSKTTTAMVDVTTHGPDDYGSADQVGTPKAQKAAKRQNEPKKDKEADLDHERHKENLAETGTDLNNKPTY